MSPSVLNQRLAELREAGIVEIAEEGGYCVTRVGRELLDALLPLHGWAKRWAIKWPAEDKAVIDVKRDDLYTLPKDLPVPVDDGACDHLAGMRMPQIALLSTEGELVDLGKVSAKKRTVLFFYPRSGRPDAPQIAGWDDIPGARGCTPQSCAYRDYFAEFVGLETLVFGVSTQDTEYQLEFATRTKLPYPLLSDRDLELTKALRLPTFEAGGMTLIKRLALVTREGHIEKVFYPVFPPDKNAEQVLAYLQGANR
jgi:peroxiredoxin